MLIWARILQPVIAQPNALDDLEANLLSKGGQPVEAVFDRVGPDALRDLGQLGKIFSNLLRRNLGCGDQWGLLTPERCIGHAFQFRCWVDRSPRKLDRRGKPPPHCRDQT